ncbi:hypothetical protein [Ectopseudomonas khazarica]|uniref:hypothetical protein n=1 Tax=Ectopseudomonas khazarica TaxID=2502979 RepID=UPI0037C56478
MNTVEDAYNELARGIIDFIGGAHGIKPSVVVRFITGWHQQSIGLKASATLIKRHWLGQIAVLIVARRRS